MGDALTETGFEILPACLTSSECEVLIRAISESQASQTKKPAGIRNLLWSCSQVAGFAASDKLTTLIRTRTKQSAFPVRAILFDKTQHVNWRVPWHQDLTIAVEEKVKTPGFGPWSVKSGITHVQPPREILEKMVSLRIHLDDCNEDNGPLQVIPGSHIHGKLSPDQIARLRTDGPIKTCEVPRCGILLLRPLLLHASFPAKKPSHRRVLHIEYAADGLPGGLTWLKN